MLIATFTGSQGGMTSDQYRRVAHVICDLVGREGKDEIVWRHGDCIGSDLQFHSLLHDFGIEQVEMYPGDNPDKRAWSNNARGGAYNIRSAVIYDPRPNLERNKTMVITSNLLIAAPKEERMVTRSGTWATVRYAADARVQTCVVFPDGSFKSNYRRA